MKRVGQIYRETLTRNIKETVRERDNVFVISYSGLSGIQMMQLRKNMKAAGAQVCVSKRSIAQHALQDLKCEEIATKFPGQMAFIWSNADSVEVSKALVKFVKDCEKVVIHGGLLDGRALVQGDVQKLSDLPSRQVLLAMLLGTLTAPMARLAGALNAKSRELLSILKQYGEKKGGN